MSPRLPRYVSPVLQIGQTSRTTHIDKLTSERTTANRTNMQPFYFPCKRLQPTLIWHFCFDQKRTSSAISSWLSSTCLALLSRLYHGAPGIQATFDKMGFDTAKKICSALTFFFFLLFFLREYQTGTAGSILTQKKRRHLPWAHTRSAACYKGGTHSFICFLFRLPTKYSQQLDFRFSTACFPPVYIPLWKESENMFVNITEKPISFCLYSCDSATSYKACLYY